MGIEIAPKRLELLHKLVPAAGTIAMMVGIGSTAYTQAETRDVENAARTLGVRVLIVNVGNESEFPGIFAALVAQQIGAVLFSENILFQDARERLIELSARHKIATLFWDRASVQAGALSSYGPDFKAAFYQAGSTPAAPQGRLTGRPAGDAAEQIRVRPQPQDRARSRP
jgi:ABC-type uncharacterized transport system substrate-binding protein